jgi:ABC-2 type transport system ATP-binding protein
MSAIIDARVIEVRGLTKSFEGRAVVSDLDLTVNRGQIYGFLGPNGSGKTTTIRMLCGLLTPDGGAGTCLGYDIRAEADAIKRQVGYMTQKFGLYEDLTIRENLTFVARVYGLDRVKARVDEALERLGLAERAGQLAGKLSGGWKQRLALAACILHEPKLLLLDEPTAGVDPKARRDFWDQIHTLAHQGLTVLVSTHYMDEAERCHEILYIAYGKLLARGTVSEVIAAAHLSAWSVEPAAADGAAIAALSHKLQQRAGVDMVAPFGALLHVCGRDSAALDAATAPERADPQYRWRRVEPSLEDVFIDLMGRSQDNFQ